VSPRADGATDPRARLALIDPSATPEEAAAIVAALERFMRATRPAGTARGSQAPPGWRLAGLVEGVERAPETDLRHPWINT
jgi:hypothetical protein